MSKTVYTVEYNVQADRWEVRVRGTNTVYNRHLTEFDAIDEAAVLNMVAQFEQDDDIYNERHDYTY